METIHIPSHRHRIDFWTNRRGVHQHYFKDQVRNIAVGWVGGMGADYRVSEGNWEYTEQTFENGGHVHHVLGHSDESGGGQPLPHLPPFYSLMFLIYVGE